jgi:hypothetical protein
MRDLTKAMMGYGWAMSVFSVQQMVNLVMPGPGGDPAGKTAAAFAEVTNATTETLDGSLKSIYSAGERLQSGMIDVMFGGFMSAGMDPCRWMRMGSRSAMQQMGDLGARGTQAGSGTSGAGNAGQQGAAGPAAPSGSGWGPMPR